MPLRHPSMLWQCSRKKPVPMIDEVLSENISCALFLDLEDFNRCTLRFSSDPPNSFADNRLFEKVQELTCKVDANVAIPLVRALLLDLGWDLLCAQLFNVQQFAVPRAKTDDNFGHAAVWLAIWRVNGLDE
jgi:hypothetical protein